MDNRGDGGVVKDGNRIIEEPRNRGIGVWLKGLLEKETYPYLINKMSMSVCLSVCTTVSLFLFNGKSFRPAVFCKRFFNLSIRFLNKNIHCENRESVILMVILYRPSLSTLPFP